MSICLDMLQSACLYDLALLDVFMTVLDGGAAMTRSMQSRCLVFARPTLLIGGPVKSFTRSIKLKIFGAFGVSVALVVVVGIFGVVGLSRVNSNMRDSYTGNTGPIADLSDVRAAQLDIRLQLHLIEMFRDPGRTKAGLEQIRVNQKNIDRAWKHYYPSGISSEKERLVADRIKNLLPQFNASTDELVTTLEAGSYFGAMPMVDSHEEIAGSLAKLIDEDAALRKVKANEFAEDSDSTFRTLLKISIVLMGMGIVAGTGLSFYLSGAVTKPLERAVWVANRIADGTLGNQFDVKLSRDEFGQLLQALEKMDQQLSDTVNRIKASTESVNVAAGEISSGNTDLSARTEEQAASLEETASSMTQLTESVRQNADNARQANALATNATDIADAGNDAVQVMVATMDGISGSSSRVSEITGVIEGIAFQTNILALNAAVEAARAGEQGRGFAVVASEVRSLAQRSAAAAKEIKLLIDDSVDKVVLGTQLADKARNTMEAVVDSVKRVTDIIGEIADASAEQTAGLDQVHQAISAMDQATQQNAALVEQAAAAAAAMREETGKLSAVINAFTGGEVAAADPAPDFAVPPAPAARTAPLRLPAGRKA